jgi:uncharacterized repeat protein (TIGR03803 family)
MKAIFVVLFAGMVGCTFAQPVLAAEGTKAREKVLHSFGGAADGLEPQAGLINVKGTLYGTTPFGGASGQGTVFALDPKTGAESVLYSFCSQSGCTDGQQPYASLIDVNGTVYGTAVGGGDSGGGIVFALDPETGTEKVLYSFCSQLKCADGQFPDTSLIDVNDTLYGTTSSGDGYDGGTVFAFDLSTGTENVVYSFCSQEKCADGYEPTANLIDVKGTLYGITDMGGNNGCEYGCVTVFSLDPDTGAEKVLYSFCSQQNCTDGSGPYASLVDVKGTLYGTTTDGGANCTDDGGCGTVFAVNPNTGAETALYSFCSQKNC